MFPRKGCEHNLVELPPTAGLKNHPGKAHPSSVSSMAFPTTLPQEILDFQGFLHCWGKLCPEACVSRECLAVRVAKEKLVKIDSRVNICETGLDGVPPGMAVWGGHCPQDFHVPPSSSCAAALSVISMITSNVFIFTLTYSLRNDVWSLKPRGRTRVSQGLILWQPLKQDGKGKNLLK